MKNLTFSERIYSSLGLVPPKRDKSQVAVSTHKSVMNCGKHLNLEQHVLLRFALALSIGCAICGTITHINTSSAISSSVNEMAVIMVNSEKVNMKDRLIILKKSAENLFRQGVNDIILLADAAEKSLNASDSQPDLAYPNYPFMDPTLLTEFGGSNADAKIYTNPKVTSWYNGSSAWDAVFKDINETSLLGNYLLPVALSNEVLYDGMYIGTETGIFRKNGWGPYDTNKKYTFREYFCLNSYDTSRKNQFVIGYDPRCRGWYDGGKHAYLDGTEESYTYFTEPYEDAGTGFPMITIARAVKPPSSVPITSPLTEPFFGVVGIDILLSALSQSVIAATVMSNGYTYLAHSNMDLIMHPLINDYGKNYKMRDLEFGNYLSEATSFEALLATAFTDDSVHQTGFSKRGLPWFAVYQHVQGTDYVIVMVVPYSDLESDSENLADIGEGNNNVVLGFACGITIGIAFLSFYLAHTLIRQISGPVEEMNNVLAKINASEMGESGVSIARSDFIEVNRLQSRILSLYLAIRFSTNAYYDGDNAKALMYLNRVETMFKGINQNHALGVVFNNKGSILKASKSFSESVLAYEKAISIARNLLDKSQTRLKHAQERAATNPDSTRILNTIEESRSKLERYAITLANRLSNLSVTHKEMSHFDQSLQILQEAEGLVVENDNFMALLRVFGNRGLTLLEMNREQEAKELFDQSYGLADASFKSDRDLNTLQSFQFAAMNKANFLKVLAMKQKPPNMDMLRESLKIYYIALTASNKMRKDMLSRCIASVQEIYKHFDGGDIASDTLARMFGANVAKRSIHSKVGSMNHANISFLVDVSPSMNSGNRIGKATDTLLSIFDTKMQHDDFIYIAAFSNKFDNIVSPTTIDKYDETHYSNIRKQIDLLRFKATRGTTHFYNALLKVAENIPPYAPNQENWVIALTDGADNGRISLEQPKQLYRDRGIKLIVITIDLDERSHGSTLRELRNLVENKEYLLSTMDGSIEKALSRSYAIAHGDIVMESL